jgi:hypothetical protein
MVDVGYRTEKVLRTPIRKKNHTMTHTLFRWAEGNCTRFWEGNFNYPLTEIFAQTKYGCINFEHNLLIDLAALLGFNDL